MPQVKNRKITVETIDITDTMCRVRTDSMRNTVIIDIDDGRKHQTIVIPRLSALLFQLGAALTQTNGLIADWIDA